MTGGIKNQFSQGLYKASTTMMERLGAKCILEDGRVFRYVKAGSGGLAAGKMAVAGAAVANHINRAVAAAFAIGVTEVSVPVGATAVTADQYKDGFLQVNDATGEGYQYKISSNTACDASGTTIVQLVEPIRVALVASTSEVSLIPNAYVAVHSTDEENVPVGVACTAIAANSFGWVQSGGQGICLIAGTPAVGAELTLSATAGALSALSTTIATTVTQPIGIAQMLATAGVDTEYKPVFLRID